MMSALRKSEQECDIDKDKLPENIRQLVRPAAANSANEGSDAKSRVSTMHAPVPLWMYLTSMAICLTVGVGVGLVFTERFMSLRNAKKGREESRPLSEGDFSDFSEEEDSHEDEGFAS